VAAEKQRRLDTVLDRRQPLLLQPRRLGLRERLVGQVAQGCAAPLGQGGVEPLGGAVRSARRQRAAALRAELLEAPEVELAGLQHDAVAAGRRGDPAGARFVAAGAERGAQPRHMGVQGLGGDRRGVGRPELFDHALRGHRLAGVQQQQRQQGAAAAAPEVEATAVAPHLHRAQDAEVHGPSILARGPCGNAASRQPVRNRPLAGCRHRRRIRARNLTGAGRCTFSRSS
jgi:hypothetical protein